MNEKEIAWDLTELFTSCNDPEISKTIDILNGKVDEIIKKYKGKINSSSFTGQKLHDLLEKHEEILSRLEDLKVYSVNTFNANTTLPETKALFNKFTDFQNALSKKLI